MSYNNDCTWEEIYAFIVEKYREIFTSLYTINDDILDDNLLYYLFDKSFVILKADNGEHHIWAGTGNVWDRYGMVIRGFARYPSQLAGPKTVPFRETDSVVIYAKRNKVSIYSYIYEYMTELASIIYIEQSNLRLSNIKGAIEGTTSSTDRLKQIFNEVLRGDKSWIVLKDKNALDGQIQVHDLNVEYIAEKYQKSAIFYHNQILEALGVNFVPMEKKERQVVDEVNANNE